MKITNCFIFVLLVILVGQISADDPPPEAGDETGAPSTMGTTLAARTTKNATADAIAYKMSFMCIAIPMVQVAMQNVIVN